MFIGADLSAIEWRVLIETCRDPVGMKEILDKEDIHTNNQIAFSLPSRLIAKVYLFRSIYNRGKGYAFTLDPDFMHVSTSAKYWDEVGQKFYKKYAGIEELYKQNIKLITQGKPLVGILGREWLIPMEHDYKGDLKIPETKAVNYPTQGTSADIMMLMRISFWNRLQKQSWASEVKLVSTVHDSVTCDAPSKYKQHIGNMFHEVVDDLPKNIQKLFNYTWVVPLACETKAGPNLKDMTKFERAY